MEKLLATYTSWRYKNTFFLLLSIILLFYLIDTDAGQATIAWISSLGYFGSFIAGIFFVLTFAVVPAGIVLFYLAETYNPILIALTAGLGSMMGDYIIFKFLKDKVFEELKPIFMKLGGTYLSRLVSTPYFAWLMPIIGAVVIASPFPDEIGIGLMGLSRLKDWQFLLLSFVMNFIGLFIIVALAQAF